MVATIVPLVQVAGRKAFWTAWIGHLLLATGSGAVLGATAAFVGLWLALPAAAAWIGIVLTLLYAARELGLLALPVPNRRAAVPFEWRVRYGRVRASWLYGLALGLGFTARTPFSTFHLMLLWLVLSGDLVLGLTTGALYGGARAMAPLITLAIEPRPLSQADDLVPLTAMPRAVHVLSGGAMAFVGGLMLSSLRLV